MSTITPGLQFVRWAAIGGGAVIGLFSGVHRATPLPNKEKKIENEKPAVAESLPLEEGGGGGGGGVEEEWNNFFKEESKKAV